MKTGFHILDGGRHRRRRRGRYRPPAYRQNIGFYAPISGHNNSGNNNGVDLTGYVDVPILLFVPTFKILGCPIRLCRYSAPLITLTESTRARLDASASGNFEPIISPVNLSWTIANDWHVATGLGIYIPNGTFNDKSIAGYLPSANFWAFEPSIGISWLHDGWNVSAKFVIDFDGRNPITNYVSGDVFSTDFGVTKTIGKWTVGVGGYWRYQFSNDIQYGQIVAPDGNRAQEFGVGPIVGYNFDSFIFEVYYERALYWKDEVAGDRLFTRLTVPLYTEKAELASLK